jgi:predicted PolB exonuclease-like 3'-5' exonuclease
MNKLILDIETIPRQNLSEELKPKFDESTVKIGNLKDKEKIKQKIDAAAKEFESGLTKKMSLQSNYCQIISLGYISLDEDNNIIKKDVLFNETDDLEILKAFEIIYRGPIQLIGWNLKSFDIPVLWKRGVFQNVKIFSNYRQLINPYNDTTIDLMHIFNNNGMGKMVDCANLLGIKSKTGMDGSMIYDAYKAGEYDKIKEYNLQDCETCYEIMERIL